MHQRLLYSTWSYSYKKNNDKATKRCIRQSSLSTEKDVWDKTVTIQFSLLSDISFALKIWWVQSFRVQSFRVQRSQNIAWKASASLQQSITALDFEHRQWLSVSINQIGMNDDEDFFPSLPMQALSRSSDRPHRMSDEQLQCLNRTNFAHVDADAEI